MISIVDVGCRYGVFPMFEHCYEKFEYFGIDADSDEIIRLKKKYTKKKIKFKNVFLGSKNSNVDLFISKHKGYISAKSMNTNSLWFSIARKGENKIEQKISTKSVKSGDWIEKNINHNFILKLECKNRLQKQRRKR